MTVEIRKFPAEIERVETGPIQFGQDWPGVFIRGDNAAWFAAMLQIVLDCPARYDDPIVRGALKSLEATLATCNLAKREQPSAEGGPR